MLLENQVITWAEMIEHESTSKIACIRLRKAEMDIPLKMTMNLYFGSHYEMKSDMRDKAVRIISARHIIAVWQSEKIYLVRDLGIRPGSFLGGLQ